MAGTFDRHDFSFKWSYAEMAPLIEGLGYDWAVEQTAKCISELVALVHPDTGDDEGGLFAHAECGDFTLPPVTVTCKPGDSLDHIEDASVDVVVMDPPYYDNVMYAELSDFLGSAPPLRDNRTRLRQGQSPLRDGFSGRSGSAIPPRSSRSGQVPLPS